MSTTGDTGRVFICPKCENKLISIEYRTDNNNKKIPEYPFAKKSILVGPNEYLLCKCTRCSYNWKDIVSQNKGVYN